MCTSNIEQEGIIYSIHFIENLRSVGQSSRRRELYLSITEKKWSLYSSERKQTIDNKEVCGISGGDVYTVNKIERRYGT